MEGFVQFAQNTVKTVSEILPFPISVSDEQGYIIGDTDPSRIGSIHTPSIEVIKANKVILFTKEKTTYMENVLPGVAVPLNFENKPVGVLGIIGNPKEVESYAYLVKKYVEMMWQETLHVQIENLEAMTLESFVQYILLNESINHEQISHYCDLLHIEPYRKRTCIVVDIGEYFLTNMQDKQGTIPPERMKKTIMDCVVRAFNGDQQDICAFLNTERIVFLKCTNSEEDFQKFMNEFRGYSIHLLEMFRVYKLTDVIIASGNICSSLDHVAQSYWEADSLIKFSYESLITPKIYSYFDWDILIEMLPHQLGLNMQRILVQRLKPLINDDAFSELKHDFITYCNNNLNISKAAEELFIHRNTLIYRLKKINNITGLDTSCFEHCTLLFFVLK